MKSTVASGPIPPMTPTIFSPRPLPSDIAGQIEDVGIAAQARRAAGMQEHHVAVLGEKALFDLVDQAVHAFAAIDRVQKNAFQCGPAASPLRPCPVWAGHSRRRHSRYWPRHARA